MTDDQVLKSPSRPDGCVPGRRNMTMRQIWVGMETGAASTGASMACCTPAKVFNWPGSHHWKTVTCVSNSHRRELVEYGKTRQGRARRVRKEKKGCRTRMSAVSPLTGEAVFRKRCMRYVAQPGAVHVVLSTHQQRKRRERDAEEVISALASGGEQEWRRYVEIHLTWLVLAPDQHKLFAARELRVEQRFEEVV